MKKSISIIIFYFLLSSLFAQKLTIELGKQSKSIEIFNEILLSVELVNTTDKPIKVFVNSFKEYGGVADGGFFTVNGKKTAIKQWGLDTNSGYRTQNFVTLDPGASRKIKNLPIPLNEAGEYRVDYSFAQDPGTMNPKWAENKKARQSGTTISKLEAEGSYAFTVAEAIKKEIVTQEITYEELGGMKTFTNLSEALADPSKAFKLSLSPDQNGIFDVASFAKIGELKNLRYLYMTIGKEDVSLPAELANIPLMTLSVDSKGGKLNFPEGMFKHGTLRWVSISNIGNLPDLGSQPFLKTFGLNGLILKELPDWIGNLESLEEIRINNLRINSLSSSFQNLTSLKKISCYKTDIEVLDNIFNNTSLFQISFTNGKLKSVSPEISKLKNCKILNLEYNELTTIPSDVYQMSQLQELNLTKNKLTQLPDGIENAKNLSKLVVRKNQLATIPKGILQCEKMKFFNGKENNFSKKDKTLKSLKKKMKGKKYIMD